MYMLISDIQMGVSCSVHDKLNPANRHRNWSMTVFWAFRHYPLLLPQNLQDKFYEAQVRPWYRATDNEVLVVRNAQTGEVLKEVNSPYAIRVHKAGLRQLLVDGIDVKVCYPVRFWKQEA